MTYAAPAYALRTPLVLPVTSRWCAYSGFFQQTYTSPASATSPTANQAIYVPFVVTTSCTFTRGFWFNGSVAANAGNVSVGIYTPDQTRRATTGAVAASGNSVIQSAAFTANYDATPGIYYMAILYSASGTNGATGYGPTANVSMVGAYTEATGVAALPATAVFATWANRLMPHFGITQTSFAI